MKKTALHLNQYKPDMSMDPCVTVDGMTNCYSNNTLQLGWHILNIDTETEAPNFVSQVVKK